MEVILANSAQAGARMATPRVPRAAGIQVLDPREHQDWNQLLLSHGEGSFFHAAEWPMVLHATYGHRPVYFAVVWERQIAALLPVVEVNSVLTGRRGVCLAFADECAPLVSAETRFGDLLHEVLKYGRARHWKYFECRGVTETDSETAPSLSFRGHVLDLTGGETELFKGFASEVRTAVRKAEGAGVEIMIAREEEAMRTFYALHCLTRQRHGLPPQPYVFFRNIFRYIVDRGMGAIVVARYERRPIAAAVYFHFGNKALYKYGASDKAYQHLRANNLVMWEAIKYYARRGLARLDFGRSGLAEEGLNRFKRGFGAVERRIDYCKYDFKAEEFVRDRDQTNGWHNHVFRRMPLLMARMAGALMYRHLS